MTYTFENLKDDVRKEAEALKVHATKEELRNISLRKFDPKSYYGCIYGMATGDCHSDRSCELIEKCCVRFFHSEGKIGGFTSISREGFEGIQQRVNGQTVPNFKMSRTSLSKPAHFSAIEAYILLPEARNANLIAFLKGETETLEL